MILIPKSQTSISQLDSVESKIDSTDLTIKSVLVKIMHNAIYNILVQYIPVHISHKQSCTYITDLRARECRPIAMDGVWIIASLPAQRTCVSEL